MTPLASNVLESVDSMTPKFRAHRAARPMLARDANSMYWMSRYIERAEHVARLLQVNSSLLMDVGELAPSMEHNQWHGLLVALRSEHGLPETDGPMANRIAFHMTFNEENPNSILNCITRARENARAIRDNISAEMWEAVNMLYWSLKSDEGRARLDESPEEFCRHIMTNSMLFQGLTDQTLAHDQGWQFTQLAKFLERADITSRVIETRFNALRTAEGVIGGALRNIYWMSVLRSCCAIEFFRRQHVGDMDPIKVASFLILEPAFPRSIRFSVQQAFRAMSAIRNEVNPLAIDPAERVLGRLNADLEYAEASEIMAEGLPNYLMRVQNDLAEAAIAMQKNYFMI